MPRPETKCCARSAQRLRDASGGIAPARPRGSATRTRTGSTKGNAMAKILCIEDSDDGLFVLHRRLSRAGFDVKVSINGTEGVDWAKTLLPDLVVMDLNLPG